MHGGGPRVAAPDALRTLVERFDPDVFDAPRGRARVRLSVAGGGAWDAVIDGARARLEAAAGEPDALLGAGDATWERIAAELPRGMDEYRAGRLSIRRNLHLGIGFLAATSGATEPGRLEFDRVRTKVGTLSLLRAGEGDPVVMLHGLGGTKASFLPTVAALGWSFRAIAVDLPGFGDSDKPLAAPYDARWFARSATALLDALEIERAHLVGNSMGGRIALEVGLRHPERVGRIAVLAPAMAWLRQRRWAPLVRLVRPELGLLQVAPRGVVETIVRGMIPGGHDGWAAAGVDEFLRSYLTARGRAAFYAALRNVYLDQPGGRDGFWTRLRELEPDTLFVWGRRDGLVPIGFARHVAAALPRAAHLELDCGHVPQLERPRETHAAIRKFFGEGSAPKRRRAA